MKAQGTPTALINNLISGRFTPVNYSKPRFENKVKAVKDQMENLNKEKVNISTLQIEIFYFLKIN